MVSTSRRRLLLSVAGAAVGLSGCARPSGSTTGGEPGTGGPKQTPPATRMTPSPLASPGTDAGLPLHLRTVADGLDSPVGLEVAPGAPDRQYLLEQSGRILIHDGRDLRDEPFLDLTDRIITGGERGLLGLAFHPKFASNRRLYVRYSAPSRPETPSGYSHTFVLAEFRADDGLRVDPGTERTILEIPEPQSNHNAGAIVFGPDDLLYIAVGDGGAANDAGRGHVEGGNGQDVVQNLLGSVLRIDVDAREDGTPYGIPDDNPLVGRSGLDEHYAWGLRNPWRMSFDGEDLLVGDVGQGAFEEVDLVERGGNYGWNIKEGTHCFRGGSCSDETVNGQRLLDPVVEYPHSGAAVGGISIIGGYVYRGSAVPGLSGRYVFGDLAAEGQLFAATPTENGLWPTEVVEIVPEDQSKLSRLFSLARDAAGELYALGTGSAGGGAFRLAPSS